MTTPSSRSPGGPRPLRVVVTCSDRKRLSVPACLRIGDLAPGRLEARCRAWIGRLERFDAPWTLAADLYCGDHWHVATRLPRATAAWSVDLWVASAGYGLVPANARVKPYGATFAPGHPDSAVPSGSAGLGETAATWWDQLARWPGPTIGSPRTLGQLAATDPLAPIIVVASAVYVEALAHDILAARCRLRDTDQLVVICTGASPSSAVRDLVIPADARLQAELGGARQSLNVRLARYLLEAAGADVGVTTLRGLTQRLMEALPPPPKYNRTHRSDAEVTRFIKAELHRSPGASCTRLLRRFREQGFACEQQRFRSLVDAACRGTI